MAGTYSGQGTTKVGGAAEGHDHACWVGVPDIHGEAGVVQLSVGCG